MRFAKWATHFPRKISNVNIHMASHAKNAENIKQYAIILSILVLPAGFEPAIFTLKGWRPRPLDDGSKVKKFHDG